MSKLQDMPPLFADNQTDLADATDTSPQYRPSMKMAESVMSLLSVALKTNNSGSKRTNTVNKIIDHFAEQQDTLQSGDYETVTHKGTYSYQLIALWEQMAGRDTMRINKGI